jgi:hypothetical protein
MTDLQFFALVTILSFIGAIPRDNRMFVSLCAFWVTVALGAWKFIA